MRLILYLGAFQKITNNHPKTSSDKLNAPPQPSKGKAAEKSKRSSSSSQLGDSKRVRQDGTNGRKASEHATGQDNAFCVVVDRDWQAERGFKLLEMQSVSEADKDGNCEGLGR